MNLTRRSVTVGVAAVSATLAAAPAWALNRLNREQMTAHANQVLSELERSSGRARFIRSHALGVLVFPSMQKSGFVVGAEAGDGVLLKHNASAGLYNLSANSFGPQSGGMDFAFALYFMNPKALQYLKKAKDFQVGVGPSVVVFNQGAEADSAPISQDVYAFPFNQNGLIANLTLKGATIKPIN